MKFENVTLADILQRTEEVGDCMEWTGHCNRGKHPHWRLNGNLHPAGRVVWTLAHEREPSRRMLIGTRCGNPRCIHPDHLIARSRSKANLAAGARDITYRVRQASLKRKNSRLTIEIVREIRASTEPANVFDARYGLSPGYAWRIRTNKAWREYGTPFAGLGART